MKQDSIVVKVDIVDGGLKDAELKAALADGWMVVMTAESTPGSILCIVQKEN